MVHQKENSELSNPPEGLLTINEMLHTMALISRNPKIDPARMIILLLLRKHQKMVLAHLRYVIGMPWSQFNSLIDSMIRNGEIYYLALNFDGEYYNAIMISFEGRNSIENIEFSIDGHYNNPCLEI